MNSAEIVAPYTNAEIVQLWEINGDWQRTCSNFLGEISDKYSKSKWIQFIKEWNGFFPA